jgi:cytochrome c oxidase cbb3-type subunit 1
MLVSGRRESSFGWSEQLTVHSFSWLFLANILGMVLATLLLFPQLGESLGPLTYGRIMPLHLNLHLYGWCSLPLLGLLMRFLLPPRGSHALARLAVGVWSASLLLGAVSWLAGQSSGKIFLEWRGAARWGLLGNLLFLWVVLALAQRPAQHPAQLPVQGLRRPSVIARWGLLAVLSTVPLMLFATTNPHTYPPVNPASGGPTGVSLLGSTLGLVALLACSPYFLGLRAKDENHPSALIFCALAIHLGVFLFLGHGDHSHREPAQILGLVSVGVWIPLLTRHLRCFHWSTAARPWLLAFAAWGILLYASGVLSFLPGVLDQLKFTNALVAHAHIAMAGMVSCLNMVFLTSLDRHGTFCKAIEDPRAFRQWQVGNLLMFGALLTLGLFEGTRPGMLFRPDLLTNLLYCLRWIGGGLMTLASARWLTLACHALVEATASSLEKAT